ncbi:TetR/AcrR family transcriptional regulator [Micromonosporaceae bacterium Da 78-11]
MAYAVGGGTPGNPEIPRTLQVLWGAGSRTNRGPRPALDLDRIVTSAIEIADRDGLATLSMARLAERLGSAPMSLYRHVANKDELLVFMQDAAPGPPPELPDGWRTGLAVWARALRAVYYAHPWILQVTAGRPPLEPGQLAWLDRGLSAFAGTTLGVRQRYDAVMTVLHFVRGEAQVAAVLLTGPSDLDAQVDPSGYAELITNFVQPDRFPALAAAIDGGLFAADPDDDGSRTFEFGLARILDGLETKIN